MSSEKHQLVFNVTLGWVIKLSDMENWKGIAEDDFLLNIIAKIGELKTFPNTARKRTSLNGIDKLGSSSAALLYSDLICY